MSEPSEHILKFYHGQLFEILIAGASKGVSGSVDLDTI
jgi:hypothetical protein